MAIAYITRYSLVDRDLAQTNAGQLVAAIGAPLGPSIEYDLSDNVSHSTAVAEQDSLYRVLVDGGNARIQVGDDESVADSTSEFWLDGSDDLRLVKRGQRLSVKAA